MAARPIPAPARLFLALLILIVGACTPVASTHAPTTAPATPTAAPTGPPPTATPVPAFPVTLTDDEGTKVTIAAEPRKIVSLTPDTTESLFALGAGSRVVGKVEDLANFPPEAASVPVVARFDGVDVEQIVALEADLVISAGTGLTQGDAVEQLRRANITVLVSYPTTVDGGLASIRRIGQAIGLAEEAATLADGIAARLDDLTAIASSAGSRPRVFYEIDVTGGIFTPPAASIYGEMFKLAGGEPISGDANYSISLEELIAADPEVILLGDAAYGATPENVVAREGWGGMTAVKDGRIVAVDDIVITRPGPRLAQGLEALIRAIHPELTLPSAAP
ncbi:MAG TPA: ABC transporter substrate-binding protein [Candidatus Limnocylindrales bacterium]|jgi:iron complex transport system substrate-binding protein